MKIFCVRHLYLQIEVNSIIQTSTYKSNFIIKFGKNLFNFMFAMLSPNLILFGLAQPGGPSHRISLKDLSDARDVLLG